jgi:DNA-binding CsgD family transcriptional regulator
MLVFNTEMHIVTFIFVVLEMIMFSHQLVFFLQKPHEKQRKYYLILLALLIVYNIFGGLFPDPELPLDLKWQYILAYGSGFIMGAYFPFYFYKSFEMENLGFQAKYGVFLFLILPFFLFFCVFYPLGLDLRLVIYLGLAVPFGYCIFILYKILLSIRKKFKYNNDHVEVFLSFGAVCPWGLMPLLAYIEAQQLTEVLLTNGGFIILTILYLRNMIEQNKNDLQKLELLQTKKENEIFAFNCEKLGFTKREIEICEMVKSGNIYKEIADKLSISERTVNKHMQNIFRKAESKNKIELLNRIKN